MTDEEKSTFEDRIHRWEAGENWHPNGLNKVVLGAIAFRAVLAKEVSELSGHVPPSLQEEYISQVRHVEELKEMFELTNPPPLSPQET